MNQSVQIAVNPGSTTVEFVTTSLVGLCKTTVLGIVQTLITTGAAGMAQPSIKKSKLSKLFKKQAVQPLTASTNNALQFNLQVPDNANKLVLTAMWTDVDSGQVQTINMTYIFSKPRHSLPPNEVYIPLDKHRNASIAILIGNLDGVSVMSNLQYN